MCEGFAFSAGGTPVAIDIDVFPLFLRHQGDTWKTRVQKQEQFSWCGRAVNFGEKEPDAIAVYFEAPCYIIAGVAVLLQRRVNELSGAGQPAARPRGVRAPPRELPSESLRIGTAR